MSQNRTPQVVLIASSSNDLVLTAEEQALIRNCRAMKPEARLMLRELSDNYCRTLPAVRPGVHLVGSHD